MSLSKWQFIYSLLLLLVFENCNSQQEIDSTIQKAVMYFENESSAISRNDVLVLFDILAKHYQLDKQYKITPKALNTRLNLPALYLYDVGRKELHNDEINEYKNALKYFANNSISDSFYYYMDALTIISMHFNYFINDTAEIIKSIDILSNKNSYFLTHAFFQLINLQNSSISTTFNERLNFLIQNYLPKMVSLLIKSNPKNNLKVTNDADLYYETMAFLLFSNSENIVKKTDIEAICALQNEDGGWSNSTKYITKSNHHASVLALWALLQYKTKN